jgi:hypothetical protein
MNEFDYRVKVFIPLVYFKVWGDAVFETIQDAVKDLNPTMFKVEERKDGVYLYLFNKNTLPKVNNGDETPEGKLWLSASEGWKIEWNQRIKSNIVTLH